MKVVYNKRIGVENMAEIISGIYKITNTITGDFYVGSSKNVKHRWAEHKCPSRWKQYKNNQMYLDMQEYGVEKFVFEILEVIEPEKLKEAEQKFIETLNPAYNQMNAKGLDIERYNKYKKEYEKSEKRKKAKKEYEKSEKRKKYKEEYNNQLCCYNDETITLTALKTRFSRAGIPHSTIEAKKYII